MFEDSIPPERELALLHFYLNIRLTGRKNPHSETKNTYYCTTLIFNDRIPMVSTNPSQNSRIKGS